MFYSEKDLSAALSVIGACEHEIGENTKVFESTMAADYESYILDYVNSPYKEKMDKTYRRIENEICPLYKKADRIANKIIDGEGKRPVLVDIAILDSVEFILHFNGISSMNIVVEYQNNNKCLVYANY